jgi:hypothetical protein
VAAAPPAGQEASYWGQRKPSSSRRRRPTVVAALARADDLSLVSFYPAGSHNHPARDACALAQSWLSLLLALEVAPTGRATADRNEVARADPPDDRGESALGCATHSRRTAQARFEVAQSSVAKYMVKRRAPPNQGWRSFLHNHTPDIAAMDLFVVQLSVSTCSMPSSSSGSTAETSSGSTSQQIRQPSGLLVK